MSWESKKTVRVEQSLFPTVQKKKKKKKNSSHTYSHLNSEKQAVTWLVDRSSRRQQQNLFFFLLRFAYKEVDQRARQTIRVCRKHFWTSSVCLFSIIDRNFESTLHCKLRHLGFSQRPRKA